MPPTIHPQIKLPFATTFGIAVKSLRVRLARSLLTLLTIAMAIAFLTNVWSMRALGPRVSLSLGSVQAPSSLEPLSAQAAMQASAARTLWLLGLSLLVCAVGISNAMLMSVMERFREIGTMKCLGALDSFILQLFFLESLLLGLIGTILGVLLGLGLTVISLAISHGAQAWHVVPWSVAALIAGASIILGLLITAAAALYPAWKASHMQPIDAMRVDA